MKMYTIEIDENVWRHLQKQAEPFIDTPNSVLTRLLSIDGKAPPPEDRPPQVPQMSIKGIPVSLAQILEVFYEIEINGRSRTDATREVAHKRGTSPHTITDKYCRQIGKKAHEIDELLSEPGYETFKRLLKDKFGAHKEVIDTYFDALIKGAS